MGNTESQCHRFILQIDDYLEQQLDQARQLQLENHLQSCSACQEELVVAQQLQLQLAELPFLDCSDQMLDEVIDRASLEQKANEDLVVPGKSTAPSLGSWFGDFFRRRPLVLRAAFPALCLAVLGLSWTVSQQGARQIEVAGSAGAGQQVELPRLIPASAELQEYTPEEIQQALVDLNLAIQYLNGVSQRTEEMIGERFLITPLQDTFNASFENIRENRPLRRNGPI